MGEKIKKSTFMTCSALLLWCFFTTNGLIVYKIYSYKSIVGTEEKELAILKSELHKKNISFIL